MANFSERGLRRELHKITGTVIDMVGEGYFLVRYFAPARKTHSKSISGEVTFEIDDQTALKELVKLGRVPDAFFHNSASVDYDVNAKRYQTALQDDSITGVEYDVQFCLGALMAAHGHGTITKEYIRRFLSQDRLRMRQSTLSYMMDLAGDKFQRINFDLKLHHPKNIAQFVHYIDKAPEGAEVSISSPNWNAVRAVGRSKVDRPINLLYTVNDDTHGTTREAFMRMVEREGLVSTKERRIGVSLKAGLASEEFMHWLNDKSFYTLIYPVDTNRDLLVAAERFSSGITSNNPGVIRVAEEAKKLLAA